MSAQAVASAPARAERLSPRRASWVVRPVQLASAAAFLAGLLVSGGVSGPTVAVLAVSVLPLLAVALLALGGHRSGRSVSAVLVCVAVHAAAGLLLHVAAARYGLGCLLLAVIPLAAFMWLGRVLPPVADPVPLPAFPAVPGWLRRGRAGAR